MGNRPLRYFQRLGADRVHRDDRVHILDEGERAQMRRIERGAIPRSALAGALSSVASGVAEAREKSRDLRRNCVRRVEAARGSRRLVVEETGDCRRVGAVADRPGRHGVPEMR